jgi:hypothetical protein
MKGRLSALDECTDLIWLQLVRVSERDAEREREREREGEGE